MNFKSYFLLEELDLLFESKIRVKPDDSAVLYIDPITGKPWKDKLRQLSVVRDFFVKKGISVDDIWVHFSDGVPTYSKKNKSYPDSRAPKLGINPKADDGGTPLAIFAYPIDYVISKDLQVPYGSSRPYLMIFKIKRDKVISFSNNDEPIETFSKQFKSASEDFYKKTTKDLSEFKSNKLDKFISKIKQKSLMKILEEKSKETLDEIIYKITNFKYENSSKLLENIKELISNLRINTVDNLENSNIDFSYAYYGEKYESENLKINLDAISDQKIIIPPNVAEIFEKIKQKILSNKVTKIVTSSAGYNVLSKNISKEEIIEFLDKKTHNLEDFISFINVSNVIYLEENKTKEEIEILLKLSTNKVNYNALMNYALSKNSKVYHRYNSLIEILEKYLYKTLREIIEKRKSLIEQLDFPFKEKTLEICKKYELDIVYLLEKIRQRIATNQKTNFVYQLSRIIAEEISEKNRQKKKEGRAPDSRTYRIWTVILKEFGLSGMVDEKDLGLIHTSERTQGLFFDAREYELLFVIDAKKISYPGQYVESNLYSFLKQTYTKLQYFSQYFSELRTSNIKLKLSQYISLAKQFITKIEDSENQEEINSNHFKSLINNFFSTLEFINNKLTKLISVVEDSISNSYSIEQKRNRIDELITIRKTVEAISVYLSTKNRGKISQIRITKKIDDKIPKNPEIKDYVSAPIQAPVSKPKPAADPWTDPKPISQTSFQKTTSSNDDDGDLDWGSLTDLL
jgi:hypothetical protein